MPFWDEYLACRRLLSERPDSALTRSQELLQEDREHFLGAWLRGAALAASGRDSLDAVFGAEERRAGSSRPGADVTEGTIAFRRGDAPRGRAALDRARRGYESLGRISDASRAVLWKVVLQPEPKGDPGIEADLEESESLARRSHDPAAIGDVLLARAGQLEGRDAQAQRKILEEVIRLLTPLAPGAQILQAHRALAIAQKGVGEFDAAEKHYQAALDLARLLENRIQESRALAGLGHIQKARGAHERAIELQTRALDMAQAAGSPSDVASRRYDIGTLHTQLGHYREARRFLEQALRLGREARLDPDVMVLIEDGLGSVEALTGHLEAARSHWEEAVATCRERGLRRQMPFLLLHLAQVDLDLGDFERAREHAEEGLTVAREVGHRRAELPLLSLRATALRLLGETAEALATAREARRLAARIEPRYLWEILRAEAATLHDLHRTQEGIALLDSLMALFPQIPDSVRLSETLRLQGNLHLWSGRPEAALPLLARSLEIVSGFHAPHLEAAARIDLGKVHLALDRPQDALPYLESGLRWIDESRSSIAASEERVLYLSRWYDDYAALARAYVRSGRLDEAFATLERTRAREMRELFRTRTPGLRRTLPGDLAQQIEAVESELAELQTRLLQGLTPDLDDRGGRLSSDERRADSLKTIWDELSRRLEREAPRHGREIGLLRSISAREVKAALVPGEILLAFMVASDGLLSFDFTPDRLNVREIPWSEAALSSRVLDFVTALRGRPDAEWGERGAALADTLLQSLEPGREPSRILYVLPDGALHHLPFEALSLPGPDRSPRSLLVERMEIVYANSATLLLEEPGRDRRRPTKWDDRVVAAFGDPAAPSGATGESPQRGVYPEFGPLPHARREVSRLAELYRNPRIFLGAEATEDRFYDEASRAQMVHLAAHAFVDDRHPGFSGIVLAPSGERGPGMTGTDGIVQAFEVLKQEFDLDLAVLSACETGRGSLLRGEGLIGLSRAFRIAGTRNLVVSLWKVDDAATADFMSAFHDRLSRGETASAALRQTKLAFLRGGPTSESARVGEEGSRGVGRRSPAESRARAEVWAPFVLVGTRVR